VRSCALRPVRVDDRHDQDLEGSDRGQNGDRDGREGRPTSAQEVGQQGRRKSEGERDHGDEGRRSRDLVPGLQRFRARGEVVGQAPSDAWTPIQPAQRPGNGAPYPPSLPPLLPSGRVISPSSHPQPHSAGAFDPSAVPHGPS